METFRVILPSPQLTYFIKNYWFLETSLQDKNPVQRIIPNGCISLVFHRGEQMLSLSDNNLQSRSFISGQSNNYSDLLQTGKVNMICIAFRPLGAKAFLDLHFDEINNLEVPIDLLDDHSLMALEGHLFQTNSVEMCVQHIENYLLNRLKLFKEYNFIRLAEIIKAIDAGEYNIQKLADASCLSYKQFKRIFSEYVGISPKNFSRIVRFQKALHILQKDPEINFAQLAFDCGCYDQAHLIREFKSFSGYTPTEYTAVCSPYSDYFS